MVAFFRPKCRHCKTNIALRPRGLCSRCYMTTTIRTQYPISTCKYMNRGTGHGGQSEPVPTDHPPGSPGKVEELARRAAACLALWHAADRKECGPPTRHLSRPADEPDAAEAA